MKKLMKLFLVLVMSTMLIACDNKPEGGDPYLKELGNNQYCLHFPDQASYQRSIKRVEITADNWTDYFENYSYEEHVVKKNDKGEVVEEYDLEYTGFGLKKNVLGHVYRVTFKVDEYIQYESASFNKALVNDVTYKSYEISKPYYEVVKHNDQSVLSQELINSAIVFKNDDYMNLRCFDIHTNSDFKGGIQFKEDACLGANGVLYIIDVPEGFYNGEKVTKLNFGYGEIGFAVGNISMFYTGENDKK